jgi:hypothetical protein
MQTKILLFPEIHLYIIKTSVVFFAWYTLYSAVHEIPLVILLVVAKVPQQYKSTRSYQNKTKHVESLPIFVQSFLENLAVLLRKQ